MVREAGAMAAVMAQGERATAAGAAPDWGAVTARATVGLAMAGRGMGAADYKRVKAPDEINS